MFIDSHIHLDDFVEKNILEDKLKNAENHHVNQMIAIGGSDKSNLLSISLSKKYPNKIFATAGYDRDLCESNYKESNLKKQIESENVVGVGETGLDYFHSKKNRKQQIELFSLNLNLASQFKKPIIVHSRNAFKDTIHELKKFSVNQNNYLGVLHCFTLDLEASKKLIDLGMMISFSGIVTFSNASDLRSVVSYIPDEFLLIETDAPYLSPVPNRGKKNEPAFIIHTARQIAELRGCSVEDIGYITSSNAKRLFSIS
tara:strand:- start:757 stop:1527 length:771 start_codon:yes stop_codon:yes gene_type:complete